MSALVFALVDAQLLWWSNHSRFFRALSHEMRDSQRTKKEEGRVYLRSLDRLGAWRSLWGVL